MKIEQFMREAHRRLTEFEVMWRRNNMRQPEQWPLDMDAGEWEEQLLSYETRGHGDDG